MGQCGDRECTLHYDIERLQDENLPNRVSDLEERMDNMNSRKTAKQRVESAIDQIDLTDRVVGTLIERPEYRFVSLDLVSDVAREAIKEYQRVSAER